MLSRCGEICFLAAKHNIPTWEIDMVTTLKLWNGSSEPVYVEEYSSFYAAFAAIEGEIEDHGVLNDNHWEGVRTRRSNDDESMETYTIDF